MNTIELEIFKHLFASIAEEMGERLMRSAYSPNIKERRDFSCALFNAQAEMIAQAAHIPVHLGATPLSVQAILKVFPLEEMKLDDLFIVNDPFAGGTHLPDITVVAPVMLEGGSSPSFFVANRAHHADVGGISPGSMPVSQHIDEEGFRIPPSRWTDELTTTLCQATRTPEERLGDLNAQKAALHIGQLRLREICHKHGTSKVLEMATALCDYTERMIRDLITKLPDGVYTFEDVIEDDGFGHQMLPIQLSMEVNDDKATLDFTASADQVKGPMNAVRAITLSAVNYAFFLLADDAVPANAGVMRPIQILTRPGSLLDAQYPAAVAAGNVETSQRITDVVLGALAQVTPDRVPAASCGSMNNLTMGGIDPRTGEAFAYYETIAGGLGAGPTQDGADATHAHMTNTLNTPVEALEHAYPFRLSTYALRENSGGVGHHGGGEGVIREYTFLCDTEVTLITERRQTRPYGLNGGREGQPGLNQLVHMNGEIETLPAKMTRQFKSGERLRLLTPGGGAWGRT